MGLLGRALSVLVLAAAVLIYHPPPWSFPPNKYLEDPVFAPVTEELSVQLAVTEGAIPDHLVGGVFLRNGANPVVVSQPWHWFDGDGMLFSFVFNDSASVMLRNRWIRTGVFEQRRRTGKSTSFLAEIQYPLRAVRALLRLAWSTYTGAALQATTGNTALLWYRKRLYALMEAALPVQVDPVTLETAKHLSTMDGALRGSLTAHPKLDPVSGELVGYGSFPPSAGLHYYVWSEGRPYTSLVSMAEPGSLYSRVPHDFAVTRHHSIFFDFPAQRMHPGQLLGLPLPSDPTPPRVVWTESRRSNVTRWAEVENGSVFHFANAWEEDGELVVVGCRSNQTEFYLELKAFVPYLYQWRVRLDDGLVTEGPLLDDGELLPFEFPSIAPSRRMARMRYVYGFNVRPNGDVAGVIKYDYEERKAARFHFGPDRHNQEVLFVPNPEGQHEDDGSLLTIVFDANTRFSQLYILNARDLSVATIVHLHTRVPMGFHTIFLPAAELAVRAPLPQ